MLINSSVALPRARGRLERISTAQLRVHSSERAALMGLPVE